MELLATLRERPGPDHMREIFDRYRALMGAGDLDGIVALFARDATWEEPVGTIVERGREAIRARYAAAPGKQRRPHRDGRGRRGEGSPDTMPSASPSPR